MGLPTSGQLGDPNVTQENFQTYIEALRDVVAANQLAVGKNSLINGSFDVWQRGTSGVLSVTSNTEYVAADRWFLRRTTADITMSRQTGEGSRYACRVQRAVGDTDLGRIYFGQTVETADAIRLAGQSIVLSFKAKKGTNYSSASDAITVTLRTGSGTDQGSDGAINATWTDHAATIGITETLTTNLTQFTATATIPVGTKEIQVELSYVPTGTAGADDWFQVENIQLEIGSVVTTFERRFYGFELALCQRYYEKSYNYDVDPGTVTTTGGFAEYATRALALTVAGFRFKVEKRSTPTVTLYSTDTGTSGKVYNGTSGDVTASPNGVGTSGILKIALSSGSASQDVNYQWTAEAEL